MRLFLPLLCVGVVLSCGGFPSGAGAQVPLTLFAPESTTLPNHHTDVFGALSPLDTTRPIESMFLRLELHGMNQVPADGQPTVFRTDLPAALAVNDSHFLLDPSQFSVQTAMEDENVLLAEIVFDPPVVFPSPFLEIVQAVAIDGHENPDGSFGSFSGIGRFQDGGTFDFGFILIPEPSSLAIFAVGSFTMLALCRLRMAETTGSKWRN